MNKAISLYKYSAIEWRFNNEATQTNVLNVDASVDLDRLGSPIGIEVISLELNVGISVINDLKSYDEVIFKFTHDSDCDASYIRFISADSVDQAPALMEISIDQDGKLTRIVVKYNLDQHLSFNHEIS